MLPTQLGIYKEDCGKDITQCPSDYPSIDIRDLCERGPYNIICINETGRYPCPNGAYRNVFCKTCWQNQTFNQLRKPVPDNREGGLKSSIIDYILLSTYHVRQTIHTYIHIYIHGLESRIFFEEIFQFKSA